VSTFHALGVRIIKENAGRLGLSRWFTILDRDESVRMIKRAMKTRGVDPKQYDPKKILGRIGKEKAHLVAASTFADDAGSDFWLRLVANVWLEYERDKTANKALDFDDLLVRAVELLRAHPEVLAHYQKRWQYIHIDEYQDTNTAQLVFSQLLADSHKNICVVGDVDQAIYGWREADFRILLEFEKHYPEATVVTLEENYRSTQTILAAANSVIEKNTLRKEKNLFTRGAEGERIIVSENIDGQGEARRVAKKAQAIIQSGVSPSEIAVLYRANFLSRALEEAFLAMAIPYHLVGTTFYNRKEVKDTLAYIRAAVNKDDVVSFARIANVPRRGIGAATLEKILAGKADSLASGARDKIRAVTNILRDTEKMARELLPSALVKYVLKRSGLAEMWQAEGEEGEERLENARELATLATRYDSTNGEAGAGGDGLEKFLEDTALLSDQDSLTRAKDGVRLMTIHAAKGLEFAHVFVVGLEDGLFPHRRSADEGGFAAIEEERRLFYVALTRAKERLYLSHASTRYIFGAPTLQMPSEFLGDIDETLIEREASAPNHATFGRTDRFDDDLDTIEWGALG